MSHYDSTSCWLKLGTKWNLLAFSYLIALNIRTEYFLSRPFTAKFIASLVRFHFTAIRKKVQKCVLCWGVISFLEGSLSEVPL